MIERTRRASARTSSGVPNGSTVWDVPLDRQPRVTYAGAGSFTPGTRSFSLPTLWTIHIYHYAAGFSVDGTSYDLRPGHIAVIPPGPRKTYVLHMFNKAIRKRFGRSPRGLRESQ